MRKTCPGSSCLNKAILKLLQTQQWIILQTYLMPLCLQDIFQPCGKVTTKLIPKQASLPHSRLTTYRSISFPEVSTRENFRKNNKPQIKKLSWIHTAIQHQPKWISSRSRHNTSSGSHYRTTAQHKLDGEKCHLILRNITKAFNKAWHLGLKFRILHLGLHTITEKLLCDFLGDREARMKVDQHMGAPFALGCGVSLGSVLYCPLTLFMTFLLLETGWISVVPSISHKLMDTLENEHTPY